MHPQKMTHPISQYTGVTPPPPPPKVGPIDNKLVETCQPGCVSTHCLADEMVKMYPTFQQIISVMTGNPPVHVAF